MEAPLIKKTGIRDLVIYDKLPEISQMILNHRKSAIVADTGSGKSLGIVFHMANIEKKTIWVSVPTVTAARSLFYRQIELCTMARIPITIGYAAEGEKNYDDNCQIVYGTSGHWRRKFLSMHQKNNHWNFYTKLPDIFMLDEIHIGSMDNDILLAIFDQLNTNLENNKIGKEIPRLVLSSATYHKEKYPDIPMIKIPVPSFPIDIKYHIKYYEVVEEEYLLNDIIDEIIRFHKEDPGIKLGHFLVFVSGSPEVDFIVDELYKHFRKFDTIVSDYNSDNLDNSNNDIIDEYYDEKVLILPAYAKLRKDDLDLIYKSVDKDIRKIIIATNVAETSITIPDVGLVIDSMLEKTSGTSQSGGNSLATQKIYQDSANQRKGRTGRNCPGICYRMITEEKYNEIKAYRPPEIQRVPLHNMILELLVSHFNPADLLKKYVDIQRIIDAVDLLIRINILEKPIDNNLPIVKDIGNFIVKFPLSVRNGAFLYHWIKNKNELYPGVVISAIIERYGPSYIWWPNEKKTPQDELILFRRKMFELYGDDNELISMCKIWNRMMAKIRGIFATREMIYDYCSNNFLNAKKIYEVIICVRQCIERLPNMELGNFSEKNIINTAIPLLISSYPDKLFSKWHGNKYILNEISSAHVLDTKRTISAKDSNFILSLAEITIITSRGKISLISIGIPYTKIIIYNNILSMIQKYYNITLDIINYILKFL
jgi:HrpA-like RNA helicase